MESESIVLNLAQMGAPKVGFLRLKNGTYAVQCEKDWT